MAKQKRELSPEVSARLADLAREMRAILYPGAGEAEGIPVWGTRFSKIETDCLTISEEIGRLMIEQAVAGQGQQVPPDSLTHDGESAALTGSAPAVIETPVGEVEWPQPQARLVQTRRDFFPSGGEFGD